MARLGDSTMRIKARTLNRGYFRKVNSSPFSFSHLLLRDALLLERRDVPTQKRIAQKGIRDIS